MNCSEFDRLIVSDEPEVADLLREHTSGCPRCAEILRGQAGLRQEVEAWVEATPSPPPHLEQRILQAIGGRAMVSGANAASEQGRATGAEPAPLEAKVLWFPQSRLRSWAGLAAAAILIIAALLVVRSAPWVHAPDQADRLLVAAALADARRAEREHARAIARLEQAATPILERAADPGLSSSRAAILLSYKDRLAYLDSTIAEIQVFLEDNQSHPGGRTVLLAAYTEKTEILTRVIELEQEWKS